ncbi:MAG: glycosyltransferase [Candidatus Omnitrophica bacterium]|nr:glycosyltransferase [Candidatus Omnitrophota bacterium]
MIWFILALWVLGFVLLWRVPVCPDERVVDAPVNISLIIPARNEEHNLERLLASVARQSLKPFEIIVVDDESTDRTADVARKYGAIVLPAPPLPDGWRGKNWACWQGAQIACGDAFLFLDADAILQPGAFERIHLAYNHGDCRGLSLGPYHEVQKPYEQLSAVFNLMMFVGMGSFSLTGSPDDPRGLFGPFCLFDRDAYQAVGGHESVRGEILENMSFCALLRGKGFKLRCLGGKGVVHFRMYPDGPASLIEGWRKAFASGASKTEPLTLALTVLWMTGGMLAWMLSMISPLVSFIPPIITVTYAAYAISMFIMLRMIGRFTWWSCALYPFLLMAFFIIFFRSAFARKFGGQVTWKGRTMDAELSKDE